MSKDRTRSTPPTTNTSPRNPTNTTERSTSRQQKHEPSPEGERTHKAPLGSPKPTASSSRTRPLEEDETTEHQSMAKRLRRDSTAQEGRSDRSSPSSDSQGGFADTEETERVTHSEQSNTPAAPPKKKRTRTLTTPHQSAVLHALLAQSRFPTTAMREEVGRAIGLSARKVQIWFQNQRQKARRPRTQNETSRPQYQYGAFPSASDLDTVNLFPRSQTHLGRPPIGMAYPEHETDDRRYDPALYSQPGITLPPVRLSGPATPGYGSQGDSSALPADLSPIAGPSHAIVRPHHDVQSPSPTRAFLPQITSSSRSLTRHHRDSSRILPPLVFPSTPSVIQSSTRSAPPILPPPLPFSNRSLSPEALTRPPAESRISATIPPPFTLQPQPQWDNSVFTIVPTGASGWRATQISRDGSVSPSTFRLTERTERVPEGHAENESESPSSLRGGRYDPVRGSVVPYETSPPPHTPPAT
ncbi:hypothetical protein AAF712_011854 [Marasmius tenuissimus]|uniref:Homeobox domain-containing protein n=1 Tax=Marasmius tenuissimus TaxID=585030 RepID=A0ABR2ZI60_9AGAR